MKLLLTRPLTRLLLIIEKVPRSEKTSPNQWSHGWDQNWWASEANWPLLTASVSKIGGSGTREYLHWLLLFLKFTVPAEMQYRLHRSAAKWLLGRASPQLQTLDVVFKYEER